MKICLDYGHTLSGYDTGANGCGYREQDLTRELGRKVKSYVESLGHTVIETNIDGGVSSINDSLQKRYTIANNNNVDLCVSIHFNSSPGGNAYGTEIFTYNAVDVANASTILKRMASLGFRNRGIKSGNELAMVRRPKSKAMLIETCFIDSQDDINRYQNNKDEIARIIAEGITGQSISTEKYYIVTKYLPKAYDGYDGVDINYVLQYFQGVKCYVRGDSKGIWIETACISKSSCESLKSSLGSWFYDMVRA